jgi:ATP-dependent protease Clp ATPase subunit
VIGQEEYKKRLAIAAAYHFAMIKHVREHPEDGQVKRIRKKNTVTAGPSGSGKTYCVEVLGDLIQINEPFEVTKDMVQDEKYFDKLFSHWYKNQKAKNAVEN